MKDNIKYQEMIKRWGWKICCYFVIIVAIAAGVIEMVRLGSSNNKHSQTILFDLGEGEDIPKQ